MVPWDKKIGGPSEVWVATQKKLRSLGKILEGSRYVKVERICKVYVMLENVYFKKRLFGKKVIILWAGKKWDTNDQKFDRKNPDACRAQGLEEILNDSNYPWKDFFSFSHLLVWVKC